MKNCLTYLPSGTLDVMPVVIYFGTIIIISYFVYKWASKSISLKKETNELLKEIIDRLEKQKK
jgi:hypothetical protein